MSDQQSIFSEIATTGSSVNADRSFAGQTIGENMMKPITKLCPKLIIEGTRLTGKTELSLALNEHPRIVGIRKYRYHSPIISAEWNGFVETPYGCSLIDFNEAYEALAMEAYRNWLSLFELYRYYSWIIDRFRISTQMWQAIHRGRKYRFEWLESRLAAIGFRLILCWRHPKSFSEAREKRLRISSNPSQYANLKIFLREQEIIEDLSERSSIPRLFLDVTELSIAQQSNRVADWLESTGGLNAVQSLLPTPQSVPLSSFRTSHDPNFTEFTVNSIP